MIAVSSSWRARACSSNDLRLMTPLLTSPLPSYNCVDSVHLLVNNCVDSVHLLVNNCVDSVHLLVDRLLAVFASMPDWSSLIEGVVVNNASSDGTAEHLYDLRAKRSLKSFTTLPIWEWTETLSDASRWLRSLAAAMTICPCRELFL
jgi:hypothetical protein